jgi:hypothetical protein
MTLSRALACLLATTFVSLLVLGVRQGFWLGATKESTRGGSDEMARLRAEIDELKQSVKVSEGFARAAVQSVTPLRAESKSGPGTPESESRQRGTGASGPDEQEITRRLERRFEDEKPDPSWSKASQRLVTEHVHRGVPPESKVQAIECRRTMCRVESQHPTFEVYKKFVDDALLFPDGGWDGPVMISITSRHPDVKAIGYLFREGEDLEPLMMQESPL